MSVMQYLTQLSCLLLKSTVALYRYVNAHNLFLSSDVIEMTLIIDFVSKTRDICNYLYNEMCLSVFWCLHLFYTKIVIALCTLLLLPKLFSE